VKGNLTAAGVLIALFLLWEAAVRAFKVKPVVLPAPSAVFAELCAGRTTGLTLNARTAASHRRKSAKIGRASCRERV